MLPKGYRKDIDLVRFTLCRSINTFSFSLQDVIENQVISVLHMWESQPAFSSGTSLQKETVRYQNKGCSLSYFFFPHLFVVVLISSLLTYIYIYIYSQCAHIQADHAKCIVFPFLCVFCLHFVIIIRSN